MSSKPLQIVFITSSKIISSYTPVEYGTHICITNLQQKPGLLSAVGMNESRPEQAFSLYCERKKVLTTSKLAWLQVKRQPRRKSTNIFSLWYCEKWLYRPWREQDNTAFTCWAALLLSPDFKQKKLKNSQLLSICYPLYTLGLLLVCIFERPFLLFWWEAQLVFNLSLVCEAALKNRVTNFFPLQKMGSIEWLPVVENTSGSNNSYYVCDSVNG